MLSVVRPATSDGSKASICKHWNPRKQMPDSQIGSPDRVPRKSVHRIVDCKWVCLSWSRIVCCCWISSRSRLTERGICSRICWTSSICNGIWLVVSKIYYFQYVSILKMYNPLIITILIGRSQRSNTFMETTNHIRSYFCFLCLKPTFWWVASDPRGRMFTGCFLLSSWPPWKSYFLRSTNPIAHV